MQNRIYSITTLDPSFFLQTKSIWKQLWTSVYPVISPQIIRDVETFVAGTKFAIKPFVEILKSSSPF